MGATLQKYKNQYKFLNWSISHPEIPQLKQLLPEYSSYAPQYIVLKNNNQQYRVYHQEFQNIQHTMELYQWRSMTSKPVIKVYHVDVENYPEYQLESQNLRGFVFTEHLVMSLDSITNMCLEDAVYILKNAFIGYSSILRVLGHVVIKESLIGVTGSGQCKVWNNNSLSLNTPSDRAILAEDEAIYQIIKIVRNSTSPQYQYFFISLLKHLDICERVIFKEVFQFIQNYEKKAEISKSFTFQTQQQLDNTFSRISFRKSQIQSNHMIKKGSFLKLGKFQNFIPFFKDSTITLTSNKQNAKIVTDRSMQIDRKNKSRANLKKSTSPSFLNMKKNNNLTRRQKKTSFHLNIVSKQGQFQSIKEILSSDNNIQFKPPHHSKKKVSSSKGVLTSIKENKEDVQHQCSSPSSFPFKKFKKTIISHQFSISILNQVLGNKMCSQVMKQSLTSTKKSNIQSVRSQSKCSKPPTYRKYRCPYKSQFLDENTIRREDHSKRHSCQRLAINLPFSNLKKSYDTYQQAFPARQNTDPICNSPVSEGFGNKIIFKNQQLSKQDYRSNQTTRRVKIRQQEQKLNQKIKQKEQEIIKTNSWKKTIQCLLNDTQKQHNITLNQSINMSVEEASFVQSPPQIKLQMLANLGREIKNSVCPY